MNNRPDGAVARRRKVRGHSDAAQLTAIMTMIASGAALGVVLDALVVRIEAQHPDALCSILLLDEAGRRLVHGSAPSLPADYALAIDGVEIGPAVGSCGTAAFTGRRVIVTDIATDPLWVNFRELAAGANLAACWSQPITGVGGRLLGTFAMYHRTPTAPRPAEISAIAEAAHLVAIAIERKASNDALAASESRARRAAEGEQDIARALSSFFEVSLDLMSVRDLKGNFVKVNRQWETVLGYPVEQLVGAPILPLLHPDDIAPTLQRMSSTTEQVFAFVNRYRRVDGVYRHLEWQSRRCGDLVFGVARDITERVALEDEMKAARLAAEEANRAKSEFLANMSHEVRTPLNGVIGVVDALAQTNLSAEQREMVDLIRASGSTLSHLVSDILDISKVEAGRIDLEAETFDLRSRMAEVMDLARTRAAEKGLTFSVHFNDAAKGAFQGDITRINQVLGNLLSNAVKFTTEGGVRVGVEVSSSTESPNAERLRLVVQDTGEGFESQTADALFERFSQADNTITRRFGGSGLGLAIVKALTEAMGGQVTVSSQPGRGSVFVAELPVTRAAQPALGAEQASVKAPSQLAPLKILLAEDNPTNQKVVQLILSHAGAELTIVENGLEAVQAFSSGHFDLVLMDMQMPLMDGLQAIKALREIEASSVHRARTPVAMLSASAMKRDRDAAHAAGADLHIAKPVTARALLHGIEEAVALGSAKPPVERQGAQIIRLY